MQFICCSSFLVYYIYNESIRILYVCGRICPSIMYVYIYVHIQCCFQCGSLPGVNTLPCGPATSFRLGGDFDRCELIGCWKFHVSTPNVDIIIWEWSGRKNRAEPGCATLSPGTFLLWCFQLHIHVFSDHMDVDKQLRDQWHAWILYGLDMCKVPSVPSHPTGPACSSIPSATMFRSWF